MFIIYMYVHDYMDKVFQNIPPTHYMAFREIIYVYY